MIPSLLSGAGVFPTLSAVITITIENEGRP